jgi:RNA polymerase sigma-70 factor (ECF subfamily)
MGQVVAFKRGEVVKKAAVRESSPPPSSPIREVNWAVLLQRIVDGDQSAVAELYDGTNTLVFGLALRILGERTAAEDVVVEVYTQVWKQAQTYEAQRGTPLAWLLTVTRSRALDALRARQRLRNTEPLETAVNTRADTPNPEEVSSLVERRRVVCQALDSLSAEQRQVIELAYFSDLSHTEIAEKLGQPLGTIKTRIRTGLLRLRELLGSFAPFTAVVS